MSSLHLVIYLYLNFSNLIKKALDEVFIFLLINTEMYYSW